MSREAIESFVDEIRDELPKIRRAFAIMHACPDDRVALLEAHRLTHSIKGTAALVGVAKLSQVADLQERLLERLLDGRLTMDDQLRDTLERLADIAESFADGLLAGTVPEDRWLADAAALCRRHTANLSDDFVAFDAGLPALGAGLPALGAGLPTPTNAPSEDLPNDSGSSSQPDDGGERHSAPAVEVTESPCAGEDPNRGTPATDDQPPHFNQDSRTAERSAVLDVVTSGPMLVSGLTELSAADVFQIEAAGSLRGLAERLDVYRDDLTRWDVLADVRRRFASLKQAASVIEFVDFTELTRHAEDLMQQVLDRRVPPTEQIADCLQACVDALDERLERPLDQSLLQLLHERIDQLCGVEAPETSTAPPQVEEVCSTAAEGSEAVDAPHVVVAEPQFDNVCNDVEVSREVAPPAAVSTSTQTAIRVPTPPESVALDDHSQLSDEMLEVFHEEVEDHLRLIYAAFSELAQNPARMSAIQDVRRSAHTIKGAAGSVGLRLVSKLSHRMEDLLDQLFSAQQPIKTSTLALLYDTTDALQDLVHGNFAPEGMQVTVAQLYDSYDLLLPGSGVRSQGSNEAAPKPSVESREPLAVSPPEVKETSVEVARPDHREGREVNDLVQIHALPDGQGVPPDPVSEEPAPVAGAPPNELVVNEFLPMLAAWNRLAEPVAVPPPQAAESLANRDERQRTGESLRVPLARIESLMREVGELIINRSAFEQRMSDFARCVEELQRAVARMRNVAHELDVKYGVGALGGRRALWGDGASLLPGARRFVSSTGDEFDALEFDRYTEFHLLSRSLTESTTDLGALGNELRTLMGDFDQLLNRQGRLSRDTQDRLMRIRLLPLATLAAKLHRTVRVVATQQHKDVDFLIQGGDTELDKLVLEELADPLLHILRNAVDHGLETAEVRRTASKPDRATIRVQAFTQGTQVVIRVSDDGAGLNFDAIRETATRHGLASASDIAQLTEAELAAFIFLPGFSTAREVSEVSGRGIGMDIVRDKVQRLKGTIGVESHAGQGTTFTIRLPMMLAVTRALLVHAATEVFALPMQSVVQILRLERKQIEQLGSSPSIRLGEESLPFVYLAEQLRLRRPIDKTSPTLPVLIVASDDHKVAVAVEKILPGRDIVVKTLGTHLRKVRGLLGATLMGDGSVVPILDVADLVGTATGTAHRPAIPAPHRIVRRHESPTIMVVDDSVSVRRVMSNLLKNAGWTVLEAKDGIDALEKLPQAERPPSLFLLDIEMPRMDGYQLLATLRSQPEHRETPIVMVTSRAGDKHRQKAMQLGATDYVVKPYQDDELLGLIRRLLAGREAVLA